jgi:two-component system sensor histidine kinase/response regulator
MNHFQQKPPFSWGLISVFISISAVLLILGLLFINSQKKSLLREKENELVSVANLKVGQIKQWRREKTGDANLIHDNLSLASQIDIFLNSRDNAVQKQELLRWMKSIIRNYDYLSANIVDVKGKTRLSVPEGDSVIGPLLRPLIPLALDSQKIIITDLHRTSLKNPIHLDLLIPMVRYSGADSSVVGLVILRIDPEKILYPLVQTWPTPSRTSETLLLRRDGDSILYLNELKHKPNSALSLRRAVTEERLIGAKAVLGIEGLIPGTDYRNVEVIAVSKKIQDSPWYMVAKVDKEEISSSFSEQLLLAKLLILFFISAFGAVIGWMIWNQRVRYYRMNYEAELERSAVRKHFDYILKYANDIILLIDKEMNIIEANDRAIEVYRYSREELIGMKIMKLRLPEFSDQLDEQIRILNDVSHTRYETIHICKDGTAFPVEISARLVEIEGIKYYQSIGRDITERKKAENLLKEREFWLSESQRVGKIGSYILDIKTEKWTSSDVLDEIFGIPGNSTKTLESWNMLVHPEDRAEMLDYYLKKVIAEKKSFDREYRILKPDSQETAWVWGRGELSFDHEGIPEKMFGTIQDITERKISEIHIEETNSLLLATLESTADGILVVDLNGKIVQFNRKFSEMWNMSDSVLNSKDDEKAISFVMGQLKDPESFVNNVRHLYEKPESVSFDLLEFKDRRIFERYSQPQRINNKIVGRVWSFRDITQRKIAEDLLINAKEKAEESDRLKTAFLHNISHEIRTPMNAIVGFTALLDDQDLEVENRKQYIEIIYQSSNQLLSIITDIVDISNIETGQTKITFSRINIKTTIRNLFEQYNLRVTRQGLSFKCKLPVNDEEEEVIETDGTKLIQILSNFLNNSLKFTKEGHIELGYSVKEGLIEFFVSDTGIGISKDKQAKIFERFYQVENSVSRQYGGTGLGLSICQSYAELLGGFIRVDSEPGTGSVFYLTLPFINSGKSIQVKEAEAIKPEGASERKTILIAEDDDINFLVVKKSLEDKKFDLLRAVNGEEAVEICRSNEAINLVLLDLKMPVMDGLEALKLIKQFRPGLPFVALTAFAFESDKRNALEQGCTDYLSKPFSKKDLLDVLKKHI